MEIMNQPRPETVEVHVKMTRRELENLISDMKLDVTSSNPYTTTEEFMNYLESL